ncbi:hypothetical protein [Kutzneria sp. CA-103260]|uniref:hypothetical protein n=1 Tax=Kutzneria sp. CA-103260 TaxID=2802641 RepID=UPI001BAB8010|nr:hypothetical protein [Kutzneria sp. CA-103260]QUQ72525.1 hypothetical protein JJ691_103140 [Kutzneria sp. CA-103260]
MNLSDVTAAARLIRYALSVRERPTGDGHYQVLLDKYRTDAEFAEIVGRLADGLGLDVRVPTPLGLLVAGRPDGPFAVTLDNCGLPIRAQHKLQDRRCFGLVLVALVAYAYPNGEALVDATNPTVRAAELERFLTRHAAAVTDAAAEADDEMDRQLGEAARIWLDLPEVLPSAHGGYRRDCQRDYVQRTLEFLVAQGRADGRRRSKTTGAWPTRSTTGSGWASPR